MNKNTKIFIAGHKGLVGSAILKHYQNQGFSNIITKTRKECDLTSSLAVETLFQTHQPDIVYLAAAKVGGIHANNTKPAEFIYENLQIQNNIIQQSYVNKVNKLLLLGSSCIYLSSPRSLLKKNLYYLAIEPTNDAYAIAKIMALKMPGLQPTIWDKLYFSDAN